jgi:diacylglycerol kinase family enzyme
MIFKNILIVYNHKAGRFSSKKLLFIKDYLNKKSINYEAINITEKTINREIASLFDAVFVVGGDGTLNDVINKLVFTDIPIAHLPMGTVNLFAIENKTPFCINKALKEILNYYKPIKVNLGKINDKYFLAMAGIGFDAYVVKNMEDDLKLNHTSNNTIKYLKYLIKIIKISKNYKFYDISLKIDDTGSKYKKIHIGGQIIISNIKYYAGHLKIFPANSCLDDEFSIRIFNNMKSRLDILLCIIKSIIFKKKYSKNPEYYIKAKDLSVCAANPEENKNIYCQVDGEFLCSLPVEIQKVKKAVTMLVSPEFK